MNNRLHKNQPRKHSNQQAHNWLIYDLIAQKLEENSGCYKGTLVDLGCGEAPYKEFFLRFCDKYVGIDRPGSLHKSKVDLEADLNTAIPLSDGYADTVVAISVMEHLYNPERFLHESFRILKNGGFFVLQVPFQWQLHEQPNDYFRYTLHGLQHLLRNSGFSEISIETLGGFFTSCSLKLNYFTRRLIDTKLLRKLQLNTLLKQVMTPCWTINQLASPFFDRLDPRPEMETAGFFAVARKP